MRKFQGHKAGLTDMAFSHDGRWLVTSSLDTTTRLVFPSAEEALHLHPDT